MNSLTKFVLTRLPMRALENYKHHYDVKLCVCVCLRERTKSGWSGIKEDTFFKITAVMKMNWELYRDFTPLFANSGWGSTTMAAVFMLPHTKYGLKSIYPNILIHTHPYIHPSIIRFVCVCVKFSSFQVHFTRTNHFRILFEKCLYAHSFESLFRFEEKFYGMCCRCRHRFHHHYFPTG